MGERSLNPRPYKAKHNSNARVEHRRAKKKRASQRSAKEGRKERKKERKKGRTRSTSRSRAEYKLLRRETWILCEEGGGSRKSTLDSPVAFFSNVLEKVGREDNEIKTSEIFLRLLLLLLLLR